MGEADPGRTETVLRQLSSATCRNPRNCVEPDESDPRGSSIDPSADGIGSVPIRFSLGSI